MITKQAIRTGRPGEFLAGGFLLLVLVVGMSVWFSARERAAMQAAQATLLMKDRLTDVLSSVRGAESGQRGYLLTGDITYLRPYQLALTVLPGEMKALQTALAGSAEADDITKIEQLVAAKLAELNHTIVLYRGGDKAGAQVVVNTDHGLQLMGQLRGLVGTIQSDQAGRLAAGQEQAALDGWAMQIVTAAAVVLACLLAWLAIRDNREQTTQLRAAEMALLQANEVLEAKVAERTRTLEASEAALEEANASLEIRVAQRSQELDRIFRLSTDLLTVIDFEGRFINVSPAWETITGWSVAEAMVRPFATFLHPDDAAGTAVVFAEILQGAPVVDFENRYLRADGSYCWLSWRSVPQLDERLIYNVARDVTQEKLREEQLRQSQKMEVVGQLTGGIAHDFNNLLTIIMGSLEMLQRGLADAEPKLLRRVDNAMDGAKRAAALTHRLLAFSRQQPLAPKAIEVNRLLAGMSDMLHRTLGETVAVEMVTGAGVWPALADGNQLENALLNLAVNARDAMPQGGHLTIETQNSYLNEAYAKGHEDVQAGQYVQIAVTDTGTGMTAGVREKVFEPFFTTKPQGQGTGLGLAQVYGFIKQSGGHIAIYSEAGLGTTVKLYLPRLRAGAAAESDVVEPAPGEAGQGRGETILLVEDEAGVRNFAAEILEELGYVVLAAENAAAALRIFGEHPEVKLLFTDVVLTGNMNGRVLANEILRQAPGVIVLFTTGYTRNAIIHHGRLDEGINFIGKPFTAMGLGQAVRGLLDAVGVGVG